MYLLRFANKIGKCINIIVGEESRKGRTPLRWGGGGTSLAQIKLPILNGRLSHNIDNDIVLPEQGSYLAISESEKWNVVLNDATDRELAVKADKDAV